MAFPNSMGFGHGPFGHRLFGHGPWVTFPFTPGYSAFAGRRYQTTPVVFTDRSEQRFLEAAAQGRRLTYSFPLVGSGVVAAIMSWFVGANGPATRFLATDHTDASTHVVRFQTLGLTHEHGPARADSIPRVIFEVAY